MPSESDQIVKDLITKTKSLASEKDGLGSEIKALKKKIKELEGEVEDAVASAEAANMGKSAVERDWTERLVKARCCRKRHQLAISVADGPPFSAMLPKQHLVGVQKQPAFTHLASCLAQTARHTHMALIFGCHCPQTDIR